jgi:hypothetical protein
LINQVLTGNLRFVTFATGGVGPDLWVLADRPGWAVEQERATYRPVAPASAIRKVRSSTHRAMIVAPPIRPRMASYGGIR